MTKPESVLEVERKWKRERREGGEEEGQEKRKGEEGRRRGRRIKPPRTGHRTVIKTAMKKASLLSLTSLL